MSHPSYLLCLISIPLIFCCSSCSSTSQASASTAATGYHKGKYYLSDSERNLTAEQLQARIKEEARVCITPGANSIERSGGSRALQLGTGVIFGVGVNSEGGKVAPASVSKAKMRAYNSRLAEMEQTQVDIGAEIAAAKAERDAALAVPPVEAE